MGKKLKKITISRTENIIAVEPKYASGPGWANSPLWVHIVDSANGKYRTECFQPDEQTPEMRTLFQLVATGNAAMLCAVEQVTRKR